MKNVFVNLSLLLLLLSPSSLAWGQDATMSDLRAITERLKSMKTYSYQTETTAEFPNGQKDRKITWVYMDGPGKRLCYKNKLQVLLLTSKWAYKADHRAKTVSIFDVVKYNDKYKKALPELDAVFKTNLAAMFMDSVVLRSGKLVSAKKKGNLTTFTIRFPEDAFVREIIIVYDYSRQLPQSIRVRSFFASGTDRSKGTGSETISTDYSTSIPADVFDERRYFQVQGAKVALSQFKNYKVSSIL